MLAELVRMIRGLGSKVMYNNVWSIRLPLVRKDMSLYYPYVCLDGVFKVTE